MLRYIKITWIYYLQSLSVELSYRLSLAQTIIAEVIGMIGITLFWLAAGSSSVSAKYNSKQLLTYFIIVGALGVLYDDGLSRLVSMNIRMGKLSTSLLRPYPYLMTALTNAAAYITVRLFILIPVVLVMLYFTGSKDIFTNFDSQLALRFLATFTLAIACCWVSKICLGLLAFYMTQTWGPELIYLSVFSLASGFTYPPDLLSEKLLGIISIFPVFYMIGFPTLTLLQRFQGDVWMSFFIKGCLVFTVTLAILVALWRHGLKEFEAIGI